MPTRLQQGAQLGDLVQRLTELIARLLQTHPTQTQHPLHRIEGVLGVCGRLALPID
ncbi:hypothetical protein D3C77_739530 [compost metagenome]